MKRSDSVVFLLSKIFFSVYMYLCVHGKRK